VSEFPLLVTKPDDLRDPFRAVYSAALGSGSCRLSLFAPRLTTLSKSKGRLATAHLLMIFDGRVLLAIKAENTGVKTLDIPFTNLVCVEVGQVLLYSWLKLVFGRDTCARIEIPFNAVGIQEFVTAVRIIQHSLNAIQRADNDVRGVPLDLPLKFQNALRRWLEPDEALIGHVFQPELSASRLGMFGRYKLQLAPPLLVALTDRQMLLITEEPASREGHLARYSWVFVYCPLSRIGSFTVLPQHEETELAEVRLTLINESASYDINSTVSTDLLPQFSTLFTRLTQ
jgi:hypothetical protein